MNYWLMKSEPEAFSIDDLEKASGRRTYWDGVRNYQARNHMRAMKRGDQAFFYHSNVDPPAVVGVVEVVREAYPDFTAYDVTDKHYDPKSTPASPIWDMVEIRLIQKFPVGVPLDELRRQASLKDMVLLRRGRLSVQPVRPSEWRAILKLAEARGKR